MHVITVVYMDAEVFHLQHLHHLYLLREEDGAARAHTKVNCTLLLSQLLLRGLELDYLACKLGAVDGHTYTRRQIFVQFELEIGHVIVETSSVSHRYLLSAQIALFADLLHSDAAK